MRYFSPHCWAYYTYESVFILPDQTLHGHDQARGFFGNFLATMPPDWLASFNLIRREVQSEIAYIFWQAPAVFPLATDTFVVHEGKIVAQTFATLASMQRKQQDEY